MISPLCPNFSLSVSILQITSHCRHTAAAGLKSAFGRFAPGAPLSPTWTLPALASPDDESSPMIADCSILHPRTSSCTIQSAWTFHDAARRSLPMYTFLTVIQLILNNPMRLYQKPRTLLHALIGITRSTTFLASFVSSYMGVSCGGHQLLRTFTDRESHMFYWPVGLLASLSLYIERKSRRSELALYVAPRAIDALYRGAFNGIPFEEDFVFAASIAALTYYTERQPDAVSPLVKKLLNWVRS